MSPATPKPPLRMDPTALPPPKWWGRYILDGNPPQRRFVLRWGPIFYAIGSVVLAFYFAAVTALWGYYSIHRAIPGVLWVDVALPPRFSHVQDAIGLYYLNEAKEAFAKKDYTRTVVTARAATIKSPANLDARLFLADFWRRAGRYDEAVRTLRDGIEFNANDTRLQVALVNICLITNRYKDLLKVLQTDLPAKGVRLLDGANREMQLAEVRAVLEVSGPTEADKTARSHPGLVDDPMASPILAQIDRDIGKKQEALRILRAAHEHAPKNSVVLDELVDLAIDMGDSGLARSTSEEFMAKFPSVLDAQLRFLEAHASREGPDETPWTAVSLRFLSQHRHEPEALSQLGSLAASNGWTDLAFLLYENSLQENLTGFPFATYYVASLVKKGEFQAAEAALRELSIRNAAQVQATSYITAMVEWGTGRESEANQIVQQLRRDTADDLHRRHTLEGIFRTFGFPKIADQLATGGPSAPQL